MKTISENLTAFVAGVETALGGSNTSETVLDLPAQDDARSGPSGFPPKLFNPERDSFYPLPRSASKFIDDDAELDGNKLPRGRHAAPINRTGRTRINNVVIQGNDAARTRRRPWTALQDRINALRRVRLNAGSKPSGAKARGLAGWAYRLTTAR